MLRRALIGVIKGVVLGALLAIVLIKGLSLVTFGGLLGYVVIAAAGAVAGLVTGKPAWAPEAKVEALLKTVVGAVLACLALFGLRRWLAVPVDLTAFGAGQGSWGELPATSLPLILGLLGLVFELDNTEVSGAPKPQRQRVADSATSSPSVTLEDEAEEASPDQRLRNRR